MSALAAIPIWLRCAFVVAILMLAGSAFAVYQLRKTSEDDRIERLEARDHGAVPDFDLTDHTGEAFGREQMLGRVSLVSFQFTRCPGICKVMSTRLGEIYREYASVPGLQIVTVSVDPDHDTPEVLASYAEGLGVTDRRWLFLHGDFDRVKELCEAGFHLPADNLPGGHTSRFALVDADGRIRGYYDSLEEDALATMADDLPFWLGQR